MAKEHDANIVLTNGLQVHDNQNHGQEHELWQASKARDQLNEMQV